MSDGPLAGLRAVDAITDDLPDFHLAFAARGELLARAGRAAEAHIELSRAIELAPSEQERRQLARRRDALDEVGPRLLADPRRPGQCCPDVQVSRRRSDDDPSR